MLAGEIGTLFSAGWMAVKRSGDDSTNWRPTNSSIEISGSNWCVCDERTWDH